MGVQMGGHIEDRMGVNIVLNMGAQFMCVYIFALTFL
jgi:hypothetical protein